MLKRSLKLSTTGLTFGITAGIATTSLFSATALAATFPDVENHWSRPFVDRLSEDNILAGYPDGTFRPEQPVNRDEFAAIIREAFNQEETRQLASGSVYKDIPTDYWAASAIEEAYEMGFMSGYPGGFFRPDQELSKVDALVSLMNVLNLPPKDSGLRSNQVTPSVNQASNQDSQPVRQQSVNRQAKRPLLFPLAMTTLMQPVIAPQRSPQTVASSTPPVPATDAPEASTSEAPSNQQPLAPSSFAVSNYYQDANSIPQYAVSAVATATQADVVVNYPNPRILNPNQPATRADVAALVHQIFVRQGKLEPLPNDAEAAQYIVKNAPPDSVQ